MKLIYPKWPKLRHQPEFHLPPHGPVCFAAAVPPEVELTFVDEHVQTLDFSDPVDLVAMSVMLSCQMPRAWEIADQYRSMGIPVIFGGIGAMLHFEETMDHADAVYLGEVEGRFDEVLSDFRQGKLKRLYDYFNKHPAMNLIGPARRDILDRPRYNFRGVQMVDLIHASRGCRFNCFPCCAQFLGGRQFRPRNVDDVAEEISRIDNNRFFFVDNSLAQNDDWEKALFKAIAPLKKKWISHPIKDDPEILDLAVEAGCWYVYQAIVDASDFMRQRVKRLKERGIGVEGTVILGCDDHDEDYTKRLVDFLLEIELDLVEFTIMTPFPHSPVRADMEKDGRILHNDWIRYTGDNVVFKPAKMSIQKLEDLNEWAWEEFYRDQTKEVRMAKLYLKVLEKERADGTYKRVRPARNRGWRNPSVDAAI
jgi:radical SAM superfamily enzyme YgiQ (UPF0313 family)